MAGQIGIGAANTPEKTGISGRFEKRHIHGYLVEVRLVLGPLPAARSTRLNSHYRQSLVEVPRFAWLDTLSDISNRALMSGGYLRPMLHCEPSTHPM